MIDPGRLSQDITMTGRVPKAQHEYITDPKNRYGPGFWTMLFLLVMLTGLAVWALLH